LNHRFTIGDQHLVIVRIGPWPGIDWSVDKLTVEHWAVSEIKEGRL